MTTSGIPEGVGAYRIEEEIGRGGMGIVYRARDTRLERDVAVKVLPEDLLGDPDRITRFEREARTLALLNHPNIAQIYGIEEQDGRKFLVLEYVEGETLEDRLQRGALAVDEAIGIAIGICRGLEAAHGAGVVHRDLKPGNIVLMRDGKIKVLDFGLAKAAEVSPSDSGLVDSPTVTSPTPHSPSIPGAILGTAPYMSPEQARGYGVDKQTDIWSFGVVLYEMLTGVGPFGGETVSDSIAAILHKDVDHDLLPPATPTGLRSVLRRCLERDKERRWHDIADARIFLEESDGVGDDARIVSSGSPRVAIAVVALVALLAGAVFLGRATAPRGGNDSAPLHAQLAAPESTQFVYYGDVAGPAKVSPDGSHVVFTAQDEQSPSRLWLRPLAARDSHALAGTEGATFPFWSPDSRSIGFFAGGKLRRVEIDTGSTYSVCDAQSGRGGTWTITGEILFSPDFQSPIHRVPATGGEPAAITEIDGTQHTSHRWPYALPDGVHFVFNAVHHDPTRSEGAVMLGSLEGGSPRRIMQSQYRAEVVDDLLLFTREGTLMAARLDVDNARLRDEPIPIIPAVSEDASTWHAGFSASPSGVLVYHRSGAEALGRSGISALPAVESNVTVVRDRRGRSESVIAEHVPQFSGSSLSPTGEMIAISALESGQDDLDIWLYPTGYARASEASDAVERQTVSVRPARLASTPGAEAGPVWSPDGTQIVYGRIWGEDASLGIHRRNLGGGDEKLLLAQEDDGQIWPLDWTRDGKWLVVNRGSWVSGGEGDIMLLSADGGDLTPLVASEAYEADANISPDGRWLAYMSAETGVLEVYVIPFAPAWPDLSIDPASPSPRWQVSVAGGQSQAWSRDGTELYFGCPSDNTLYSVPVDITGDAFRAGPATPLFQHSWNPGTTLRVLDLDSGPRFFISDVKQLTEEPISVVLNWKGLLERRAR